MRIGKPLETLAIALEKISGPVGGDAKAFGARGLKGPKGPETRAEIKKEGADRRSGGERKDASTEKRGGEAREQAKTKAFERMKEARAKVDRSELDKEVEKIGRKEATERSFKKAEYFHDIEERRRKREAAAKG